MDTDEHPLRALFDAVHSERHQSAAYDVGSAVQGAVNENGGVRWRDGEVVQNIDGDAITVRFDDGVEETYRLPDDRSELRSVPQNIKDEDAMSADKTNTGHGEADSAGVDSQEYDSPITDREYECLQVLIYALALFLEPKWLRKETLLG